MWVLGELPPERRAAPSKQEDSAVADIDIIRYDPKELSKPPYRLIVHSISPVFAKQARRLLPVSPQAF